MNRVLATVMFTDIVGSTEKAAELGDRRWQQLLEGHHSRVRAQLQRFRGREIDTAGDGFLATFDGPARAVECAQAIADSVRGLGLEIRAGCYTGEIELEEGSVRGIAVHIGARVTSMAGPGEILVTSTVKTSSPDRVSRSRTPASTSSRRPGPLARLQSDRAGSRSRVHWEEEGR